MGAKVMDGYGCIPGSCGLREDKVHGMAALDSLMEHGNGILTGTLMMAILTSQQLDKCQHLSRVTYAKYSSHMIVKPM